MWEFWMRSIANCLSVDLLLSSAWTAYQATFARNRLSYVCNISLECLWRWRIAVRHCSLLLDFLVGESCEISVIINSIRLLRSESSSVLLRISFSALSDVGKIDWSSALHAMYSSFSALSRIPLFFWVKFGEDHDHVQQPARLISIFGLESLARSKIWWCWNPDRQ